MRPLFRSVSFVLGMVRGIVDVDMNETASSVLS